MSEPFKLNSNYLDQTTLGTGTQLNEMRTLAYVQILEKILTYRHIHIFSVNVSIQTKLESGTSVFPQFFNEYFFISKTTYLIFNTLQSSLCWPGHQSMKVKQMVQ